eukprot:1298532-Lingulodinium_polyedra.AAC.1
MQTRLRRSWSASEAFASRDLVAGAIDPEWSGGDSCRLSLPSGPSRSSHGSEWLTATWLMLWRHPMTPGA